MAEQKRIKKEKKTGSKKKKEQAEQDLRTPSGDVLPY